MPTNLPNILTLSRIGAIPLLIATFYVQGPLGNWLGLGILAFAGFTDFFDGYFARAWHQQSFFGKFLDPIADKVLTGFAFIGLSILGELPWWITIVVLIREVGITIYRFIVVSDHVLAAAWMGKLKTVAQAVALSLALLPLWNLVGEWIFWVNGVAMTIAVVLTIASGIDYVVTEIRAARTRRGEVAPSAES